MHYYFHPEKKELFAYDDEQVAQGIVRPDLVPMQPRPSLPHVPDPANIGEWMIPLPAVPQSVTKRQAVQALIITDKIDAVEAALAAMPGKPGMLARAEWNESQVVERNRKLTKDMGAALGLTTAELDQLFILAATL